MGNTVDIKLVNLMLKITSLFISNKIVTIKSHYFIRYEKGSNF